jgi:hypothetical protein
MSFSCAFMRNSNRVLTNQFDELVEPKETYQEVLLSPIFIPIGAVSLLTDALILHPISVIPKSLVKTYEIIWFKPQGGVIRQSFLFIPKLILTPITLAFTWLGYSIFDI